MNPFHSDWLRRVDDPRDFGTVAETGKVGIMVTCQNSEHFESVDDVDLFYSLGQKVSQLTYNFQNRLGSGFLEHRDGVLRRRLALGVEMLLGGKRVVAVTAGASGHGKCESGQKGDRSALEELHRQGNSQRDPRSGRRVRRAASSGGSG